MSIPYIYNRTGETYEIPGWLQSKADAKALQLVRCVDLGPGTHLLNGLRLEQDPWTFLVVVDDDHIYGTQPQFPEQFPELLAKSRERPMTSDGRVRMLIASIIRAQRSRANRAIDAGGAWKSGQRGRGSRLPLRAGAAPEPGTSSLSGARPTMVCQVPSHDICHLAWSVFAERESRTYHKTVLILRTPPKTPSHTDKPEEACPLGRPLSRG